MRKSSGLSSIRSSQKIDSILSASSLTDDSFAVPIPGPGVCANCCTTIDERFEVCWSCARVAISLNHPLLPITPICLVTYQSRLYRALRQYKWTYSPRKAWVQSVRVSSLLAKFLAKHRDCITPEGWNLVTVVPSLNHAMIPRVGQHPLYKAISHLDEFRDSLADLLAPGSNASVEKRNVGSPSAYQPISSQIKNARILLIDDIYTTGAHLQSAYLALKNAGAKSVSALVIGRKISDLTDPVHLDLADSYSGSELQEIKRARYSIDRCIHCARSLEIPETG